MTLDYAVNHFYNAGQGQRVFTGPVFFRTLTHQTG